MGAIVAGQAEEWIPRCNATPRDWKAGLRRFNSGGIIPQLANVIHALKFAPELAGILAYDEFALQTVVRSAAPWHTSRGQSWQDNDDIKLAEWCQHNELNIGVELAAHGVKVQ